MIEVRPIQSNTELCLFVEIASQPSIFHGMVDDLTNLYDFRVGLFNMATRPDVVMLGGFLDNTMVAIALHTVIKRYVWDGHLAVLPEYRLKTFFELVRAWKSWIRGQPVHKIVGYIPSCHTVALKNAETLGFKKEGVLSACYRKLGHFQDLEIWSYSVPQIRSKTNGS